MDLNSPKELICLLQCEQFIPFTPVDSGSVIIKFWIICRKNIIWTKSSFRFAFFCLTLFIFTELLPLIVSHSFLKYWAQLCAGHCAIHYKVLDGEDSAPAFKGITIWWGIILGYKQTCIKWCKKSHNGSLLQGSWEYRRARTHCPEGEFRDGFPGEMTLRNLMENQQIKGISERRNEDWKQHWVC